MKTSRIRSLISYFRRATAFVGDGVLGRWSPTSLALSMSAVAMAPAADVIPPGVPEPGLVLWGSVVNRTNTAQAISIVSAEWTVTDGVKTAAYSGDTRPAVRIMQRDGQSYYILEVPFDTRRLGTVNLADPASVGLDSFELKTSSPPTYVLTAVINGALATVRAINGAPASGDTVPVSGFTAQIRGRVIRVDLAIVPLADSYDTWAAAMFGDANLPEAMRDADPDEDGLNNEGEFMAGTDPNDPNSLLRLLTLSLDPATQEATLQWQSVSGKGYRVQVASEASGPWDDIGSRIAGADDVTGANVPPPAGSGRRFYRIRLEP